MWLDATGERLDDHRVKKLAKWSAIGLLSLVGALASTVAMRWDRPREAPLPALQASTDPEVIERGRHLVWGPAHCAGCHGQRERLHEYEQDGTQIPLAGGWELDIPPATLRAPNITPDEHTGIGSMSDAELARALRHGIGRDGNLLFPIMPFSNLSDEDLVAVISYLRAQDPVAHEVPRTEVKPLGKILYAFVLEPTPSEAPASMQPAATAEYGEYLAKSVANCYGCHTNRDLATGEFTGEPMAGGLRLEHGGKVFVPPNITPEGEGSKLAVMDEAAFVARMRMKASTAEGSPMPWISYATMTDVELAALWAYLQSVPSVDADTGPVVLEP